MADTSDVNSLFAQLLEYQWKGVSFPTTSFMLTLRHDLAQHRYGDRDGANIESTGRAPLQFDASIPFLNGAVPGRGETWGILYPTQYRKFIEVASVGSTGVLQHPEFGEVPCKLEGCRTVWSAERRDGVVVECTWLETIQDNDRSFALEPSPVGEALLSATDLDGQIQQITPAFPTQPQFQPSFAQTLRSITAVSDQIGLLAQRQAGQIGAVQYRLNVLQQSIDNIVPQQPTTVKQTLFPDQTLKARACLNWPMRGTIEQMRAAVSDLRQVLGATGRPVLLYVVPIDMTLAAIAQNTKNDVRDIIKLNPQACRAPYVRALSTVRAYAA